MPSNITVNGEPLEVVLDREQAAEISEVREQESGIRLNRHGRTKHNGNHSRLKSKPGQVIYRAGQKETHVIINGFVFPWEAKMPYVPSGGSTLGAIEYNEASGEIKCHECSEWMMNIPAHLVRHRMTVRSYRLRHGFKVGKATRLKSPTVPKIKSPAQEKFKNYVKKHGPTRRRASMMVDTRGSSPESENLNQQCLAQFTARIKTLAQKVGRTPTDAELKEVGINRAPVERRFGMKLSGVFRALGLKPRRAGSHFGLFA